MYGNKPLLRITCMVPVDQSPSNYQIELEVFAGRFAEIAVDEIEAKIGSLIS